MNKTQDITKVPMERYAFGKSSAGFHTKSVFFFKDGGVRYYVDNIGDSLSHITVRNSHTGVSKIVLMDSELGKGKHRDTYFFQYD